MRERRFQRETQSTMSKKLRKKGKTGLQRCRLDTQSTCIVYTIHAYDMASLRLVAKVQNPFLLVND